MELELMYQCFVNALYQCIIFSYSPLESCKQQPVVLKIFTISLCFGLPLILLPSLYFSALFPDITSFICIHMYLLKMCYFRLPWWLSGKNICLPM